MFGKNNKKLDFREEGDEWGRSVREEKKQPKSKNNKTAKVSRSISVYRKIAVSFVVLTLVLAAVVVYFSVVSVKIIIIPNKERTGTSFIAAVKDKDSNQEATGAVISGLVRGVPAELESAFSATGKEVEDVAITGVVTIYNTSGSEQPLIKTTRLLSLDQKLFRLKNTVRVPANGQLENVEIYADEPNEAMAIGPTRFAIPGLNQARQKQVYAESKEKFKYEEVGDSLVSSQDIAQAKKILKQQLEEKMKKITESSDYRSYDNVISKIDENKIQYNTEAKAGDKANEFKMSAKAEAAVVAFSTNDISELAKLKVAEALPDDKELQSFDKENFEYQVEQYNIQNGIADLKVDVVAQMVLKEGTEIINPERLVGLSREQLDDYLSSLREIAGYEIKFTPNWISKVPSLVDHVKVEVAK